MKIRCRKPGFPVKCPHCEQLAGCPNGKRQTLAKVLRQQMRCRACKRQWSAPVGKVEPLFSGQRIRVQIDRLLQGFALMVVGIPMCRVGRLVGIKAQTVKEKLMSILKENRWEELKTLLEKRFSPNISRRD